MNFEKKREILKYITLGTGNVLYYPYNYGKEPLPVRSLSSFELDECYYNSLEKCTDNRVASFVVKYRIQMIKGKDKVDLSNELYRELLEFYNEIDYWIVYYGMKDFQNPEFSMPDYDNYGKPKGFSIVKDMIEVHAIATFILSASTQSEDVIKEIFEDGMGREVASLIYYLKIPLGEFSKLTRLQKKFLIYVNGHIHSLTEDEIKEKYVRSDEVMTYEELLERFK